MRAILRIGDKSTNGQVTIVDEDRLCYLVRNESKGANGIRTISKSLLDEFVSYIEQNPDANPNDARNDLSGKTKVDKFEYGYSSTLVVMAKMIIDKRKKLPDNIQFTNRSLQQIYYGAPGTGKSHSVKIETEAWEEKGRVVRTTFHPDSDYSTFVGCYKPTMRKTGVKNAVGKDEEIIVYEFVPQAFLQAYVDAWKNREEPQFLVIEEINRGNCAQIFGDLFQLLDRGDDGYSEYAIRADKDLQTYLSEAFEDVEIDGYHKVKSGEELLLPNNFFIRATMNTSDQSLFPIDSAFKRRWDWKYIPIAKGIDKDTQRELNWEIETDGERYNWWDFLSEINRRVFDTTNSEDKQLGFFFCKANNNSIISAETFVSKVIFYLWNDVFKDYGFEDSIFNDETGKLSFDKFYDGKGNVIVDKVRKFLTNLKLEAIKSDENAGTEA